MSMVELFLLVFIIIMYLIGNLMFIYFFCEGAGIYKIKNRIRRWQITLLTWLISCFLFWIMRNIAFKVTSFFMGENLEYYLQPVGYTAYPMLYDLFAGIIVLQYFGVSHSYRQFIKQHFRK